MADNVDLARLVVSMEAQSAKYLKALEKSRSETHKWRSKVQKSVGGVAKDFRNLVAAAGIATLTRKIIQATAQQERAVAQLRQGWQSTGGVVGRSVDDMIAHAQRLQDTTIFGDEQIIEAQSQLVTFTNIVGEQFDRTTAAALDLSTRMGTDLKSSVVQLGKALNDPIANLSALSRSGIQFSDSQKDMIKTLVQSGRMMEAQDIILAELERQFGGSAIAARDTFGGALTAVGNAFGDLLEGSDGSGGLTQSKDQLETLTQLLQDPQTRAAADSFTGALITAFTSILGLLVPIVDGIKSLSGFMASVAKDWAGLEAIDPSERIAQIRGEMSGLLEQMEELDSGKYNKGLAAAEIDRITTRLRELHSELTALESRDALGARTVPGAGAATPTPTITTPGTAGGAVIPIQDPTKTASQFETLQRQLMNETEAFNASYQERLELIDEFEKTHTDRAVDAADARNRLLAEKNQWLLEKEEEIAQARMDVVYGILDVGIAAAKEDSKLQRGLMVIKKVIALREAAINLQRAISNASAIPFPANIPAIATAAAQGAQLIATIKGIDTSLPSFEGGGYTGGGARSGGMDGKGGFLAMVHPNESIVDHAKGGGVMVQQNIEIDARGAGPEVIGNIEDALERNRAVTIAEIIRLKSQGKL